jgi:hypothetical protein
VVEYVANHIPAFAKDEFASTVASRMRQRGEETIDSLREGNFLARAPRVFRIVRSKNMHTAKLLGKRSRELEHCAICMDEDKVNEQILRCGHCMCQDCLV